MKTIQVDELPNDLLNEAAAAQFLGLSPNTLKQYRTRRRGPRYYRVPETMTDSTGRTRAWYRVYYSQADLEEWAARRRGFALRRPVLVEPEQEDDSQPTLPLDV